MSAILFKIVAIWATIFMVWAILGPGLGLIQLFPDPVVFLYVLCWEKLFNFIGYEGQQIFLLGGILCAIILSAAFNSLSSKDYSHLAQK